MNTTIPSVTPQTAAGYQLTEWQLLDVRLPSERGEGHIRGSVHIELVELPQRVSELDQGRPVLVYCRSGSRATMAAEALLGAGYQAQVLEGGMLAWIDAGLEVEKE